MAAFFTLGLQSQTTLETFFCARRRLRHPAGGALVSARLCRLPEQEVHQPKLGWCNRGPICLKCTNRSLVGAAETAAPPDPRKSRVSPGNYIAKINGVHREVMCWHLLSTTHAGCNTRELIPLWHLLGRLPLTSRLAVAHGEVHR